MGKRKYSEEELNRLTNFVLVSAEGDCPFDFADMKEAVNYIKVTGRKALIFDTSKDRYKRYYDYFHESVGKDANHNMVMNIYSSDVRIIKRAFDVPDDDVVTIAAKRYKNGLFIIGQSSLSQPTINQLLELSGTGTDFILRKNGLLSITENEFEKSNLIRIHGSSPNFSYSANNLNKLTGAFSNHALAIFAAQRVVDNQLAVLSAYMKDIEEKRGAEFLEKNISKKEISDQLSRYVYYRKLDRRIMGATLEEITKAFEDVLEDTGLGANNVNIEGLAHASFNGIMEPEEQTA